MTQCTDTEHIKSVPVSVMHGLRANFNMTRSSGTYRVTATSWKVKLAFLNAAMPSTYILNIHTRERSLVSRTPTAMHHSPTPTDVTFRRIPTQGFTFRHTDVKVQEKVKVKVSTHASMAYGGRDSYSRH
jgi:hypothetical protein